MRGGTVLQVRSYANKEKQKTGEFSQRSAGALGVPCKREPRSLSGSSQSGEGEVAGLCKSAGSRTPTVR